MSGLQGQTGHDSPEECRAEMERLLPMLDDMLEKLDKWEQGFVASMYEHLENTGWAPTPKQLFKARDIKDKY
jgi:hypothetical protein